MKTVLATEDVSIWWRVKHALRKAHITLRDCRIENCKMLLEVMDRDVSIAKMIVERTINHNNGTTTG